MSAKIITSPLLKTYTLEEFWQLPDPPDRLKLELIAGVIYVTPPPEYTHDDIASRTLCLLSLHVDKADKRGGLYVPRAAIWADSQTHLEPDMFYVSSELAKRLEPEYRDTADLVAEIVSPGSAVYEYNTKAETYGALGVRELWLIDEAAQTVEVRMQAGSGFDVGSTFSRGQRVKSAVFPTLRLNVKKLFED